MASQIEVQPGMYLLESNFEWLISRRMSGKRSPSVAAMTANATTISVLWDLEILGIREPNLSNEKEEELTLQQFYVNISYNNDSNRYSVTWLWRSYPRPIPSNYGLAAGVLRTVLRRTPNHHLDVVEEIFDQQFGRSLLQLYKRNILPISSGERSSISYNSVLGWTCFASNIITLKVLSRTRDYNCNPTTEHDAHYATLRCGIFLSTQKILASILERMEQ